MSKASKTETETETEIDAEVERAPQAKTNAVDDITPEPGADTEVEAEAGTDAEPEIESEAASEPEAEEIQSESAPTPQQSAPRARVFPLILGGVVAALIGFGAGRADLLGQAAPAPPSIDLSPLERVTAQQAKDQHALAERIRLLETRDPGPTTSGTIEPKQIDDLTRALSALEARVAMLEDASPVRGAPQGQLTALAARLDAQQSQIDRIIGDVQAAEQGATAAANATLARALAAQISAAIPQGLPFAEELKTLQEISDIIPDAALRDVSSQGVTSLTALQASVAEAARAGLAAARASDTEGAATLGAFLREQLGARSVVPKEGTSPDAVLSRLEAATKRGDLRAALNEAEALPAAARDAMSGWIGAARINAAALRAAQALVQSLETR